METSRLASVIKLWVIWALVAVLLLGADRLGVLGSIHSIGEPAVNFVAGGGERVVLWAKQPLGTLAYWRVGASRMASLEERLAEMAVDRLELEQLRVENEELKQEFTNKRINKDTNKALVKVINSGERLLVEKVNGVTEGSVVVDLAGVLVGKVVRVAQHTVVVGRPGDAGVKIAVKVGNSTGLIEGDGQSAQLTGVLQAEPLKVGDVVTTSGVDDQFPPGLVIGQVAELTGKPADVTKGGVVELLSKVGERVVVY